MDVTAEQWEKFNPNRRYSKMLRIYVCRPDVGPAWVAQHAGRRGAMGPFKISTWEAAPPVASFHNARRKAHELLTAREDDDFGSMTGPGGIRFQLPDPLPSAHERLPELQRQLNAAFLAAWAADSVRAMGAVTATGLPQVTLFRGLAETARSQPWAAHLLTQLRLAPHADRPGARVLAGSALLAADGSSRSGPAIVREQDFILALADPQIIRWLTREAPQSATFHWWTVLTSPSDLTSDVLQIALGLLGDAASGLALLHALQDAQLCLG